MFLSIDWMKSPKQMVGLTHWSYLQWNMAYLHVQKLYRMLGVELAYISDIQSDGMYLDYVGYR